VNFGPLTAEIGSGVWGTPANFKGFRVFAALLHGTLVVGVSQTLRRWTESATYIRQGPSRWVLAHVHSDYFIIVNEIKQKCIKINPNIFSRPLWSFRILSFPKTSNTWGGLQPPPVLYAYGYHGLRGSASAVLTATGLVNRRWQFSTPTESTPLNRSPKNWSQVIRLVTPTALPNSVHIHPRGLLGEWVKYNYNLFIHGFYN